MTVHPSVWLERYHQMNMLSGEQSLEGHARRCPNLRGPTPTKHCSGLAREGPTTPSTTTSLTAVTPRHRSPPSGPYPPCPGRRSSTATIPPRSPCAWCAAPSWHPVGRQISSSTPSVDLGPQE